MCWFKMTKYFLDTCFIFHALEHEHNLIDFCSINEVSITSFNILEIEHNLKKINPFIKKRWKDFEKNAKFEIFEIDVVPGNPEREKEYVTAFDEKLLKLISDPSDAVLLVSALQNKANIITRDKHHLFTTKLENYLDKYKVRVVKELPKC